MSTVIGVLGLLALVAAGFLVHPVAGLIALGVALLWVAHRIEAGS